jgi:superfamily II DNA or RNA helicase
MPFENKGIITVEDYFAEYQNQIREDSERLFVEEFLFNILNNEALKSVIPQYPFIDSEGHCRHIDFATVGADYKIAFEVNGETYHGEGIIPADRFDDNLFRQNEILFHGWTLIRFSYNQLKAPEWRSRITNSMTKLIRETAPHLLAVSEIKPNIIQSEVLSKLEYYRSIGWGKGLVVMPTGTGKTYLAAMDAMAFGGRRTLFVVHNIAILTQAKESFQNIWKNKKYGFLGAGVRENLHDSDILFASKDSLCKTDTLALFDASEFDYIIVDEVHHGQAPTYSSIFRYFTPKFLLGVTATPERTDRKSILELFDYNLVCDYDINDAINRGFLVAYTYYGLLDNVDYSRIRHNGNKFNVSDLERSLIIDKRNGAVLEKYRELCNGDKAIGFCVSIKHAKRMAEYFNEHGVSAIAITSERDNENLPSAELIAAFRSDEYSVAFTIDMFNEGIDVPNVRALLFLRPTESKTVFQQQLGRGLRLSSNKNELIVLDFIGNYQRANKVRDYLSTGKSEKSKESTGAFEKYEYHYNPKCKIEFQAEIQEILDTQDKASHEISKEDLTDAYYDVTESLKRKPTQEDINSLGLYKVSRYINTFGSWLTFLREIGEATESSYHYPQGVHLGHLLYILDILANDKRKGSNIDYPYVKMRGGLDENELGRFQRQTKYKLQAMMEIGFVLDDRAVPEAQSELLLTEAGKDTYTAFEGLISAMDFSLKTKDGKDYSWEFEQGTDYFTSGIRDYLDSNTSARRTFLKLMLKMDALNQFVQFIYSDMRRVQVSKADVYKSFFKSPSVQAYCDMNGIDPPTDTAAEHRVPFLINVLEAGGLLKTDRSMVHIERFPLCSALIKTELSETDEQLSKLKRDILDGAKIEDTLVFLLRERLGTDFLTDNYPIKHYEIVEE